LSKVGLFLNYLASSYLPSTADYTKSHQVGSGSLNFELTFVYLHVVGGPSKVVPTKSQKKESSPTRKYSTVSYLPANQSRDLITPTEFRVQRLLQRVGIPLPFKNVMPWSGRRRQPRGEAEAAGAMKAKGTPPARPRDRARSNLGRRG
jgi:hypothetical protein